MLLGFFSIVIALFFALISKPSIILGLYLTMALLAQSGFSDLHEMT